MGLYNADREREKETLKAALQAKEQELAKVEVDRDVWRRVAERLERELDQARQQAVAECVKIADEHYLGCGDVGDNIARSIASRIRSLTPPPALKDENTERLLRLYAPRTPLSCSSLAKSKFVVGQRVCISKAGVEAGMMEGHKGTVVGFGKSPTDVRVVHDGAKSYYSYHMDFLEPDPSPALTDVDAAKEVQPPALTKEK